MNHAYETYQLEDLITEDLKRIDEAGLSGNWEHFKDVVLEVTGQQIINEDWDDVVFVLDRLVTANIDLIRGFDNEEYQSWELI